MSDETQGRKLSPFPINDETKAALRHALDTCIGFDEDGKRITIGGDFTMNQLLDFYSGADESRGTYVGDMELMPGVVAPTYEMWDQNYSINDVVRALLDALESPQPLIRVKGRPGAVARFLRDLGRQEDS